MKCYNCRLEITEDALFCPKCGRPQKFTDIVKMALQNDQDALSQLYKMTYNNVYQTIRAVANLDDDTVFDLVQNTYTKAFRSLSQLNEPEAFRGWVKVISRNLTIDHLRKKKAVVFSQMVSVDSDEVIEFEDDRIENLPEVVVDKKETARLLGGILDRLSEEQRIAVYMYYFEQLSIKEIADTIDVSEGTVKSRLNYGRKKIEAGVNELEKKGTKLYGLAPVPFLLALFRSQEAHAAYTPNPAVLQAVEKELVSGLSGFAQAGGTTNAVEQKATMAAGKETVKAAAGATGKSILTKVIIGVVAASVIGAGAAGIRSMNRKDEIAVKQENKVTEPEVPVQNMAVDDFIGGYTNEEYMLDLSYVEGQLFLSSGMLSGKEMSAYAYDDVQVEGNTLKAFYEECQGGDVVNDDGTITEGHIDRTDIFVYHADGTLTVTFDGVNENRSGRYRRKPDLALDDPNLITDAYSDVVYEEYYNQKTMCYHIPQINLRGSSVMNTKIYNELYGILDKDVYTYMGDAGSPFLAKMEYSWGIKNKLISIIVETAVTRYPAPYYYIYNVSAATGEEASAEELVRDYGLSMNEFYSLVEETLKAFCNTHYDNYSSSDEEFINQCVELTLAEENVKGAIPYINTDGELCIVSGIHVPAGGGFYWYKLNTSTKTEEDSITCPIDHLNESGTDAK